MAEELISVSSADTALETGAYVKSLEDDMTDHLFISGNASASLAIMKEFADTYDGSLEQLKDDASHEEMSLKLKVFSSCVRDLREQNVVLIRAVEQVRQRASERISSLENRLRSSTSRQSLNCTTQLHRSHSNKVISCGRVQSEILRIQSSTIYVKRAEQVEKTLRRRVFNLQNDISGLLAIIRRARQSGDWDAEDITFFEVTMDDIFGPASISRGESETDLNNNSTRSQP